MSELSKNGAYRAIRRARAGLRKTEHIVYRVGSSRELELALLETHTAVSELLAALRTRGITGVR